MMEEVNKFKKVNHKIFIKGNSEGLKYINEANKLLKVLDPYKNFKKCDNITSKILHIISVHFDITKLDYGKLQLNDKEESDDDIDILELSEENFNSIL